MMTIKKSVFLSALLTLFLAAGCTETGSSPSSSKQVASCQIESLSYFVGRNVSNTKIPANVIKAKPNQRISGKNNTPIFEISESGEIVAAYCL